MKISAQAKNTFFQISTLLILLAAILHSFSTDVAKYTMAIGVIGFAVTTFTNKYPGKSIRGKRMFNIQIFAVLFMAVSTYLMFAGRGEWVVTLLIAAVLTLYCSIMLPRIYKKEQEDEENTK